MTDLARSVPVGGTTPPPEDGGSDAYETPPPGGDPGTMDEPGGAGPDVAWRDDPAWTQISAIADDETLAYELPGGSKAGAEELRRAWPAADLRVNSFYAMKAAETLLLPEDRQQLDLTHPVLIKAAARLGRMLATQPGNLMTIVGADEMSTEGEAPHPPPIDSMPVAQQHRIKNEIAELMREHQARSDYTSAPVQRKMQALFRQLYGGPQAPR